MYMSFQTVQFYHQQRNYSIQARSCKYQQLKLLFANYLVTNPTYAFAYGTYCMNPRTE